MAQNPVVVSRIRARHYPGMLTTQNNLEVRPFLFRIKDCCRSWLSSLLVLGLLSCVTVAQPELARAESLHALLVGVSKYDNLEPRFNLKGPVNDVALIRAQLIERGFSHKNITVLSDADDANARATREAILRELDRITSVIADRDTVFLHFAGHGSQQPDQAGAVPVDELDGMDEIFLPADVGKWDRKVGAVVNAIVDDEVRQRIDAMRQRGAFVWIVFDSCHSGTMLRASGVEEWDRSILPEDLEIPDAAIEAVQAQAAEASAEGARGEVGDRDVLDFNENGVDKGGLVAFYAAQTTQATPEMRLPRHPQPGDPEPKIYGLFSYNLARILARYPQITYQQAAEQIFLNYKADNRLAPTPLVEGSATDLDRVIFTRETRQIRQWLIEHTAGALTIPAGRLYQLSEGTILAIIPNATAVSAEHHIGYARIVRAGTQRSAIELIDYAGRPAPDAVGLPNGALARVEDAQFNIPLRVALPDWPEKPSQEQTFVRQALERLQTEGAMGLSIEWVREVGDPDVRLVLDKGPGESPGAETRLWFLPASGVFIKDGPGRQPSIALPNVQAADNAATKTKAFYEEVATYLSSIGRTITLFEIARELSSSSLASTLNIRFEVTRAATGKTEAFGPLEVPRLYEGDVLSPRITNTGKMPVDLTILFVDSRFGIEPWFPHLPGESNRVLPGETVGGTPTTDLVVKTGTIGLEQFVILAAVVQSQAPRSDFSFLQQETLRKLSGPRHSVLDLLAQAGVEESFIGQVRSAGRRTVDLAAARIWTWCTSLPTMPAAQAEHTPDTLCDPPLLRTRSGARSNNSEENPPEVPQ